MALITDLKAYWKLDGNSNDSTSNSNDGTDYGITYGSSYGKIGQGAYHDSSGSTSKLIKVPASSSLLSITNQLTISFWVKFNSLLRQTVPITMRLLPDPTSPYASYGFNFFNNTNELCFNVITNNGGVGASTTSYATSTGIWYHFIGTYDGSNIRLYRNSGLIVTAAQTGNIDYGSSRELRIADYTYNKGQNFDGSIDEVGIWSRALTSDEISKLYNNGDGLQYPFSTSFIPQMILT